MKLKGLEQEWYNACMDGKVYRVKNMLAKGFDIHYLNELGLYTAAQYNHLKLVSYLVENGADINNGDSHAFHIAVENGHLSIVKYFTKQAINIDAMAIEQITPLMRAASKGNLSILSHLIKSGADLYINNGQVLITALKNKHHDALAYLFEQVTDISKMQEEITQYGYITKNKPVEEELNYLRNQLELKKLRENLNYQLNSKTISKKRKI